MTRRNSTLARSLELALAAPAVIAIRAARMAAAGAAPGAADQREMSRMVSEKGRAFTEAWIAMSARQQRAQIEWWLAFARALWTPWMIARPGFGFDAKTARGLAKRMQRSQAAVLAHGLTPLHRTATANLRRLSKARTR
jgi:hypothetical protein